MKLLTQLLDRAVAAVPPRLHGRVVVFGSAPMVFAGLKPDVTFDLDLFVDDATYRDLLGAGKLVEILATYAMPGIGIYAVLPGNRHIPQRVRILLDFVSKKLATAEPVAP